MIAFVMVMIDELGDGAAQRGFTDENQAVETRFLDRSNKALRIGVQIRGTRWEADHLDASRGECVLKPHGEQGIVPRETS